MLNHSPSGNIQKSYFPSFYGIANYSIRNVLCQIVHDYYLNMVLGYIIHQCVVATTTYHFNWDALNSLLITLVVFQCQVPNFPQIWEEILSRPSNAVENNWTQACSFACHPSCHPPLFSLTFVLPDMPTGPWEIHTQWSE
jgi:hypothetical protein